MTAQQFRDLIPGDVVKNRRDIHNKEILIVHKAAAGYCIGQKTFIVTDAAEWDLILKAQHSPPINKLHD